jgi:hypothetical protein
MHRQLHPRRRPPAAAVLNFSGQAVTPAATVAPLLGVHCTAVSSTSVPESGRVPSGGTRPKIVSRLAGAAAPLRASRALSTGPAHQSRKMPIKKPLAHCHAKPGFPTSTGMTPLYHHTPPAAPTVLHGVRLCALGVTR